MILFGINNSTDEEGVKTRQKRYDVMLPGLHYYYESMLDMVSESIFFAKADSINGEVNLVGCFESRGIYSKE
jgi:hypothetical protein